MTVLPDTIEESFRFFFDQHYEKLCSYAYSFLKDDESCEDVVQEIFIAIWEKRRDLIGSDQLRFYIFSAVRNNCIRHLKKNQTHRIVELTDENEGRDDDIFVRIDPAEAAAAPSVLIAKAMGQLPPKCREVFLLSRLSDQSYQQIADTLGISVKTVENQMGKALKIMREFARENRMYSWTTFLLITGNYLFQYVGVFTDRGFY